MRVREFSQATGYSEVTLRKYIKEGILPAQILPLGKRNLLLIDEKYVLEFKERYKISSVHATRKPKQKKREPRVYHYNLDKRMKDLAEYNREHGTYYSYGERQAKGIVG